LKWTTIFCIFNLRVLSFRYDFASNKLQHLLKTFSENSEEKKLFFNYFLNQNIVNKNCCKLTKVMCLVEYRESRLMFDDMIILQITFHLLQIIFLKYSLNFYFKCQKIEHQHHFNLGIFLRSHPASVPFLLVNQTSRSFSTPSKNCWPPNSMTES